MRCEDTIQEEKQTKDEKNKLKVTTHFISRKAEAHEDKESLWA